jgi:hypothetical protein
VDNLYARSVFFVTKDRVGRGRVFIGLGDDQVEGFCRHIEKNGIKTTAIHWGARDSRSRSKRTVPLAAGQGTGEGTRVRKEVATDFSGRRWMKHWVLKGDTGRLRPKQSRRV